MSNLAKLKKEELILVAEEIGLEVSESMTKSEIKRLIEESEVSETEVKNAIDKVLEKRSQKSVQDSEIELERLKLERLKIELQLAQLKANENITESSLVHECKNESEESLDSLIRSVRTLTIKLPSKSEAWGFFFNSLERAYSTKKVPEKFKAEILLNLLGERASNILTYIEEKDLNNYEEIKSIVLREFEPTAQAVLENFRNASRENETHVQFASRLTTNFDYYLKLRGVTDFETLKQLMVSDKLFSTLDRDTATHIKIRESEKWFRPIELGKECDLYFTSRGKVINEAKKEQKIYNSKFKTSKTVSKVFFNEVKNKNCDLCGKNENHPLYACPQFKRLSIYDRVDVVKNKNACFKCLSPNCSVKKCSYRNCFCGKPHNKLIHFPREAKNVMSTDNGASELVNNSQSGERNERDSNAVEFATPFVGANLIENKKNVILPTVKCLIKDRCSQWQEVRCLLDGGSQISLMSHECLQRLQLKSEKINQSISCVSGSMVVNRKVTATVTNKNKSFERNISMLVTQKITDLIPNQKIDARVKIPESIELADCDFNVPGKIDILIGAEYFFDIIKPEKINAKNANLTLQNSVFGYILGGSITSEDKSNSNYCGLICEAEELNSNLRKFWEIEEFENELPKSEEHVICEEHFEKNVKRDSSGRYIVKMPLKDDPNCLGKSRDFALKKLNSLWNRFLREPEYLDLYRDFLREYEEMGHMKEISKCEEKEGTYYIPHLGIYRPDKSTTKMRVVFNASSRTTLGNSLNSLQYNGGIVQEDLFSIMVRFRKHCCAFVADIKKMYRTILIDPSQTKLLRILWKEGVNEPVKTYELQTVTYGTVSAPHLATRVLLQLARDEQDRYPMASPVMERDFYMDDVLSGAETLSEAKELKAQLIEALESGCMQLHKWCSNKPELKTGCESEYSFQEETKALGVSWKPSSDHFTFRIKLENVFPPTKRSVLSTISRIFDPLGLLGPVVLTAKVFMQKLWCLNLDWSNPLPEQETQQWQNFIKSLLVINNFKIQRCILIEKSVHIELHGFADASESAYGCVIYCKSVSVNGNFEVNLVCSKSRVSPLKRITIPRLELNAAVLLARLITKVKSALQLKCSTSDIYLWSDSMIVLSWIRKEPHLLKTFVGNRIAKIQDLTTVDQWRHVSSESNPADLISRGMDSERLVSSELWFKGPAFLTNEEYPNREIPTSIIKDEFTSELKISKQDVLFVFNVTSNSFIEELFNISNNYTKILHVISYLFRCIYNMRNPTGKISGPLSSKEIRNSEVYLLKKVQCQEFPKELKCLSHLKNVPGKSKIKCLNPFLNTDGLLRVHGRIKNSNVNFDSKFPIILPKSHKLTKLILESYHKRYFHLGPTALLHFVRQKFWPVQGKASCRKVVHNCVECFRAKPTGVEQLMGDLPKERVTPDFPFNCSGVDFCGPFLIKYKHQRKGIFHKIYVCLFVCLVTKAIHLEMVTDLSSEAFVACLKRFVARRGLCSKLFSDNATNFTGANKELLRLHNLVVKPDSSLANYMSNEGIDWSFLPPRAPNFGGLWESGVKAFKYYFKRVVSNAKLTYEDFLTVITQIEGILNSRPLVSLSSDTDVYDVLTPAHFLIGRSIHTVVEPNLIEVKDNHLSNWKKLTKLIQVFWKKWQVQYLNNLQQRSKWMVEKDNVKVNELVLLKDENLPPQKWALGRVMEVYFGDDKRVRVVKVKTQSGIFKRPISKICILPVNV